MLVHFTNFPFSLHVSMRTRTQHTHVHAHTHTRARTHAHTHARTHTHTRRAWKLFGWLHSHFRPGHHSGRLAILRRRSSTDHLARRLRSHQEYDEVGCLLNGRSNTITQWLNKRQWKHRDKNRPPFRASSMPPTSIMFQFSLEFPPSARESSPPPPEIWKLWCHNCLKSYNRVYKTITKYSIIIGLNWIWRFMSLNMSRVSTKP